MLWLRLDTLLCSHFAEKRYRLARAKHNLHKNQLQPWRNHIQHSDAQTWSRRQDLPVDVNTLMVIDWMAATWMAAYDSWGCSLNTEQFYQYFIFNHEIRQNRPSSTVAEQGTAVLCQRASFLNFGFITTAAVSVTWLQLYNAHRELCPHIVLSSHTPTHTQE